MTTPQPKTILDTLKRYDLVFSRKLGTDYMEPDAIGDYCKFEDAEAIIQAQEERIAKLREALKSIRQTVAYNRHCDNCRCVFHEIDDALVADDSARDKILKGGE